MSRSLAPRRAPTYFQAATPERVGAHISALLKRHQQSSDHSLQAPGFKLPTSITLRSFEPYADITAQTESSELTNASAALRTIRSGHLQPGLSKVADMAARRGVSPISIEQLEHTVSTAKQVQHVSHAPRWVRDAAAVHGIWQGLCDGRMLQVIGHASALIKRQAVDALKAATPGLGRVFTAAETSEFSPTLAKASRTASAHVGLPDPLGSLYITHREAASPQSGWAARRDLQAIAAAIGKNRNAADRPIEGLQIGRGYAEVPYGN